MRALADELLNVSGGVRRVVEKLEGTCFYNYERKDHLICKVQRPWSMRGVCPTKQSPASSLFSQTLRTQSMGLLQCLPEDALMASKEDRSAFY